VRVARRVIRRWAEEVGIRCRSTPMQMEPRKREDTAENAGFCLWGSLVRQRGRGFLLIGSESERIFAEKNYDRSGEPILCPIREAIVVRQANGKQKDVRRHN